MADLSDLQARLINAFNRQDWPVVRQLALQLQPLAPLDAMAPFMGGVAHMQLQQLPQAIDLLRQATLLQPGRADFAAEYAKSLALARRMAEAKVAAEKALALGPANPMTLDTLGVVFSQTNAHEQSVDVFRRLVAMVPNHPQARFNLAYALTTMGDAVAAEQELEACIRLEPRFWIAHWNLAQLRRQTPDGHHVERLKRLQTQYSAQPAAQLYLNMALAKECEDLGNYPEAFEHYRRAKTAGRRRDEQSVKRDEAIFKRLVESFPVTEKAAHSGDASRAPIFIIGMPRTGTTLLDRILSSHPDVHSAGELQDFPASLQRVSGSTVPILLDPDLPARVRSLDWQALGASYLAATNEHAEKAPYFIDKLPHNFLYAGFIARALPKAKIICLRRDPLDTCLGNFRHLFEQETSYYDYSFDLLDTGRYYIGFDRLMAHWNNVLPGRVLEVHYESLVESQEAATRKLLEFCGLPWNDTCLQSEHNAAPVNTPNAWQVRAPIYRTALGRWRNYEPQLRELRDLLVDAGVLAGTQG
ncbi:tetratricopeptide repeat-containing sulfotransferase family protein [Dyella caseinilytica]|uniref:Sulfotransferase n=1 Tax=Dyella caseinilytica TaxID=1849581 RepID=A0ABX7GWD3_9GAMM|nr:sulfotransferase [Dyella caseinilytica]QRN54788.1 sulfotransferase [Dyella caseinilytica]GFZ96851.1 sulfotransferase [Dyella caseinilytica]